MGKQQNVLPITLSVALVSVLCVAYHDKLTRHMTRIYHEGSYKSLWQLLKITLRFLLFSLCLTSYFWDVSDLRAQRDKDSSTSKQTSSTTPMSPHRQWKLLRFTDSILNNFLQIGFTAFWPRRTISHVIIHALNTLTLILLPLIQVMLSYSRVAQRGEFTFFSSMKVLRKIIQLALFIYGVYLGQQYFRRPAIYEKDIKFAKMPWKKFRNREATTSTQHGISHSSTKWILFGLLFTCVLEAFLMEYYGLNRREGARIPEADRSNYSLIFFKFLTGSWTSMIYPVFVYPELLAVAAALSFVSFGKNILRGLLTYGVLISGHVTVVTILSLVIVWEIERFEHDLNYNLIEAFEKVSNVKASSKRRLDVFDQIKIKRDELIPALSVLFHYLVIDRLLFIVLDFWNFTCDTKIEFNLPAFCARHLFQLLLTGWVVLRMARFNVTWPYKLIDTVRRWRLQSWIHALDDHHDGERAANTKSESTMSDEPEYKEEESTAQRSHLLRSNNAFRLSEAHYFLDKEFQLWSEYLSQERFVKRFGFRIFGYRVDIRWFTMASGFQLAFIAIGMKKTYFGSASEWIC